MNFSKYCSIRMATQGNDFFNNDNTGNNTTDLIKGLDNFRKRLEKDFYADVTINSYGSKEEYANLSIEIICNFPLSESLYYLQNPVPHSIYNARLGHKKTTSFLKAYTELQNANTIELDITELTISLTDTTILISKIYEQSICDQLENIATELCHHNIYYTKGLMETPFEIYIPVFEEDDKATPTPALYNSANIKNTNEYFIYWGVYYENTDEAAIYDLQSQKIIHGDLQLLNE